MYYPIEVKKREVYDAYGYFNAIGSMLEKSVDQLAIWDLTSITLSMKPVALGKWILMVMFIVELLRIEA